MQSISGFTDFHLALKLKWVQVCLQFLICLEAWKEKNLLSSPYTFSCSNSEDTQVIQLYSSTHSYLRQWMMMIVQLHAPAALPPEKDAGAHWIWSCLGHRASLDVLKLRKISSFCLDSDYAILAPLLLSWLFISFVNYIYICIPETLHDTYVTLYIICI